MKLLSLTCLLAVSFALVSATDAGASKPLPKTLEEEDDMMWKRILQSMSVAPPTPRPPTPRPPSGSPPTPRPPSGPAPTNAPGPSPTNPPPSPTNPPPSPTNPPPTLPAPEPTEAPPTGAPPTNPLPSATPPTPRPPNQAPTSQNIAEIIAGDGRFTTLTSLIIGAGLLPGFESEGPLTLFAPTNQAFVDLDLPADTDPDVIEQVLLYHVVAGRVPLQDQLTVNTLQGQPVTLTVTAQETKVEESDIIDTIDASNGVIYVIDSVLVPDLDPAPARTPNGGGGNDSCPDGTGCGICPDGTIADDSRVVTIDIPGTGNTETATCAEWFAAVCIINNISPQRCTNFQTRLSECCSGGGRNDAPAPAPATTNASTCKCDICPQSTIEDGDEIVTAAVPGMGITKTAICTDWQMYGCSSAVQPDLCSELQVEVSECCATRRNLRAT